MTASLPKLLVATEFAPNTSGGGPAIVRQMLRGWPTEKLFWWSCFAGIHADFGQKVAAHTCAFIPKRLYPHYRYRGVKSWLLENIWTRWAAAHLQNVIHRWQPEIIWCIPHGWSIPPLKLALIGIDTPFHASIHDYANINSCVFRFGRELADKMAKAADYLYVNAVARDAISEPMLADLRTRTGCQGTITRAGLEPKDFGYIEGKKETTTEEIRIAYAGSIVGEETFILFVQAMGRLRSKLSKPVTLELFSAHSYRARRWFDSSWMREHGLVSEEALSNALKNFTWGFAPMFLTDEDPRYNRFSLPTKLATYMAAGLPVIVIGHPESTLVKLARIYQIGCCITSGEVSVIENELFSTLSILNPWSHFRSEIQRCALAEFDGKHMRERLRRSLSFCALNSQV